MSEELYTVVALLARYLFAILGFLIVLRFFLWMLADRMEKRSRSRSLPDAGYIGEFVVISGGKELPEGGSVSVPWEGILGSVRSSDLCVPCDGVRSSHLFFSFMPGRGLLIHPLSGREAQINGVPVNCHTPPENFPLTHGSFLQVGSALLRLRVFTALDPKAGFDAVQLDLSPRIQTPEGAPMLQGSVLSEQPSLPPMTESRNQLPANYPPDINPSFSPGMSGQLSVPPPPSGQLSSSESVIPEPSVPSESIRETSRTAGRRRRSDRWEADWSE